MRRLGRTLITAFAAQAVIACGVFDSGDDVNGDAPNTSPGDVAFEFEVSAAAKYCATTDGCGFDWVKIRP